MQKLMAVDGDPPHQVQLLPHPGSVYAQAPIPQIPCRIWGRREPGKSLVGTREILDLAPSIPKLRIHSFGCIPGGPSSSLTDFTLPCQLCTLTFPQVEVGQGEQEEGGLWLSRRPPSDGITTLTLCLGGPQFPHLHCSNIYHRTSQSLLRYSGWVSNFCHPQTSGLASNRWRPIPPSALHQDLSHNPQPHLLAAQPPKRSPEWPETKGEEVEARPSQEDSRGRSLTARLVRTDGEVTGRRDGGRGSAMWRGQCPGRPTTPFPPAGPDGRGSEERDPRSSLPHPGALQGWISFHTKGIGEEPYPTRRFGAIR